MGRVLVFRDRGTSQVLALADEVRRALAASGVGVVAVRAAGGRGREGCVAIDVRDERDAHRLAAECSGLPGVVRTSVRPCGWPGNRVAEACGYPTGASGWRVCVDTRADG